MAYLSADQLVAVAADKNLTWESKLDYELVQDILGHAISTEEWDNMTETLDDIIFELVMSYQE
jgi:hypothetical protein